MLNTMPQNSNILDVDLTNPENSIFIPVNCIGVMGKGLALDFKKMYPKAEERYKSLCTGIGRMTYESPLPEIITYNQSSDSWTCLHFDDSFGIVVLFPTKKHWKGKSNLFWIDFGLKELAMGLAFHVYRKQVKNMHIPKLGCGLGGLNWKDVKPLIEKFAEIMPEHQIWIYE